MEGYDTQSTVSLIERGQRDTLFDIRKLLAFADAVDMPRKALVPLILGRADATLIADHNVATLGDAVDRRDFNGMAAGAAGLGCQAAGPRAHPS